MKIAIISQTSPTGSAIYSSKLCSELGKRCNTLLLGDTSFDLMKQNRVLEVWHRHSGVPYGLAKFTNDTEADIVSIQYEYSMFGDYYRTHVYLPVLISLLRRKKTKIIVTLHGVLQKQDLPTQMSWLSSSLRPYYRFVARNTAKIILLNTMQREALRGYGINDENMVVIPHGADDCSLGVSVKRDSNSILFQGFIRPSKGLDIILKAVKKINTEGSDVRLTVLGSRPLQWLKNRNELQYFEYVKNYANKMQDTVELRTGFFDVDLIRRYASQSYIIALPYTDSHLESSGVLHALMGCGTPVIASRTPRFLGDLHNMEDAVLIEPNETELAEAILLLRRDRNIWEHISENLKRKSLQRTWSAVAARHLEVFAETMRR